jgi:hypothetical protein
MNPAFKNQVLIDDLFSPIQPLVIRDLQTRPERPFLKAAGRPCIASAVSRYVYMSVAVFTS